MTAAPQYPDFPKEEYDLRYQRARQLMADAGLDALFVTWPTHYVYFTGHGSGASPEVMLGGNIRPQVFLLPLEGEPVCFVMPYEEGHVRLNTWINDVRTYQFQKYNDVFAESIGDLGLVNGRIGCELGREQYLALNYNDFNELQSRVPGATFVDASEILLRLRMIKSPAEVERCRTAMIITARALDKTFDLIKPGMTNLEVAQLVRRLAAEGGAEDPLALTVFSGYDFTKGKTGVPNARPLEVGDTLTVDTSWVVKGYVSDVARTAVIGRASQQQKDQYKFGMELNYKCYAAVRPGNLCEDVMKTCLQELERLGRKTQAVGRIGHGVGAEGTEYPSLTMGEKVPFEPGMIFACNPNFTTEFGFFNMEDDLVVTEDGYELLSDPLAPQELQVLG